MCGLFGVAGPGIIIKDLKIFKELGVVSQLRGTDGAGVYQVRTNTHKNQFNHECYYKTCNSFNDLLDEVASDKKLSLTLMDNVHVDLLMGHTRWATRGWSTTANAHPFIFPELVGMHNGTLRDPAYQHQHKTDSEMMFAEIADFGLVDVLSTLHEDSAYAITMYDRHTKTMLIAKNSKRPFSMALLKSRNVVFWASEAEMLRFVLRRHGEEHQIFNLLDDVIYRLTPSRIDKEKTGSMFTIVHRLKKKEEDKTPKLTVVADNTNTVVKDVAKEIEEQRAKEDKEPKKEQSKITVSQVTTGKILPMLPKSPKKAQYEKGDTRQYHLFCKCGKDSLNLFEAYMCKNGAEGYPKYDAETNTFDCQIC